MARYELIDPDGIVCNIIELEPGANWAPPPGFSAAPEGTGKEFRLPRICDAFARTGADEIPFDEGDYVPLLISADRFVIRDAFPDYRVNSRATSLSCEFGDVCMNPGDPGEYECAFAVAKGRRAKGFALKLLNSAFRHMFTKTNAVLIRGQIDDQNHASLRIVSVAAGVVILKKSLDNRSHASCSVGAWAEVFGVERAISEMISGGQEEKARKLAAVFAN